MEKVQSETWVGAMTPEQILELAKQQGFVLTLAPPVYAAVPCAAPEQLIAFARAVAQRTRGECAAHFDNSDAWVYRSEVAAAIRSMGDE